MTYLGACIFATIGIWQGYETVTTFRKMRSGQLKMSSQFSLLAFWSSLMFAVLMLIIAVVILTRGFSM
jgi:hypothetical protein